MTTIWRNSDGNIIRDSDTGLITRCEDCPCIDCALPQSFMADSVTAPSVTRIPLTALVTVPNSTGTTGNCCSSFTDQTFSLNYTGSEGGSDDTWNLRSTDGTEIPRYALSGEFPASAVTGANPSCVDQFGITRPFGMSAVLIQQEPPINQGAVEIRVSFLGSTGSTNYRTAFGTIDYRRVRNVCNESVTLFSVPGGSITATYHSGAASYMGDGVCPITPNQLTIQFTGFAEFPMVTSGFEILTTP